ncbi:unnamed protein product [Darwinula stevensoni]|uniref:Biogenesis of lysosome-related organelles complex 1 subunit 4 n=1 Tax=Darwinula stevensoni TaxID=69355 RepID=A0A7R9A2M0_9CRUS|nr:unnamed protein product [Darwinula stevensoni]CAG0880224.1 unnamed protein product [Darwinula stevensoni]
MATVRPRTSVVEAASPTDQAVDPPEAMLKRLAQCLAEALRVDTSTERKGMEEAIDDLLIRLDEYACLVDMVRSDNQFCLHKALPNIISQAKEMDNIYRKVDALEAFMDQAKGQLDALEHQLTIAESASGTGKSIRDVLKPLFFKSTPTPAKKTLPQTPSYEAPQIFHASEFFHKSVESPAPDSTKTT